MDIRSNTPRDLFLYLLAIIALVMTTTNLGAVLFQFVNIYVPDVLTAGYFQREASTGIIRFSIAALIIVFPVLVWVWRVLRRDISEYPEKKELKIRRWLLCLTLFVAGMVVIGDLIAFIRTFLEGEITLRFVLKILIVFVIAVTTLWYYLNELHGTKVRARTIVRWVTSVVVLASVVVGFFVAGSPTARRLDRLDEERIADLQSIQRQIVSFWQGKVRLPANLGELRDDISGYAAPRDPDTNADYVYQITGVRSFKLCADFQTEKNYLQSEVPMSEPYVAGDVKSQNWNHGKGTVCFNRTIDPQLYPPLEKVNAPR